MSIDVRGIALYADIETLEFPSQTVGQAREVRGVGEGPAKTELPFENALRPGEAAARQRGGRHASFRGFPEMETLDHRALLTARKFHEPPGVRAGDSQRMNHFIFIEVHEPSRGHRSAKCSGQPGRMEAPLFKRISRGHSDARH